MWHDWCCTRGTFTARESSTFRLSHTRERTNELHRRSESEVTIKSAQLPYFHQYIFILNVILIDSIDGDSDSLTEFRDISPMKSPIIDETATNISYKVNGYSQKSNVYSNQPSLDNYQNGVKQQQLQTNNKESNSFSNGKENHNQTNGTELSNGFHSSPLRSQLGLNLKSSTARSTNLLTVINFLLSYHKPIKTKCDF